MQMASLSNAVILLHLLVIFSKQSFALNLSSSTSKTQHNSPSQNEVKSYSKDTWDQYDYRFPDGSYEFRYELKDGTTRYERGYFMEYEDTNQEPKKSLAVVGYYAYRSPNGKYITVFYNADRFGYRQNQGNYYYRTPLSLWLLLIIYLTVLQLNCGLKL